MNLLFMLFLFYSKMIEYHQISEKDSLKELTILLNEAYKFLSDMGFKYVASYQDAEETKRRIDKGICYLAVDDGKIIGTICYYPPKKYKEDNWFSKDGIAKFGQFAVDPSLQKQGIGDKLLKIVEERAKADGVKELALDTSEGALHLIEYYDKKGYRYIETVKWDICNYNSVIMSKKL